MVRLSKQAMAILLMFLFLIDFSFPSISFIYNKKVITKEIKKLIKENLPLEKITKLDISLLELGNKEVFRWVHSKEFYYKGNLYDILEKYPKINNKNSVTFFVFHDIDEQVLIKNFAGNSAAPFKDIVRTIKSFSYDFVFDKFVENIEVFTLKIWLNHLLTSLIFNFIQLDSPPPES